MGSCKEIGEFKSKIRSCFNDSEKIRVLLLGDDYDVSEVEYLLDEHIFSHLYINGIVTKTESYIFYDVKIQNVYNSTKNVKIIISAISHKDIIDDITGLTKELKQDYKGNRGDKMSEVIEEILCEDEDVTRDFGIGCLSLVNVDFFITNDFYGRTLTFEVPNFR